jgi:hypothetical protein
MGNGKGKQTMNKQNIIADKTWRTILISPEMKNWLLTEKGKRELITYDQVLRQLKLETTNGNNN